jgi:hypothetical protein
MAIPGFDTQLTGRVVSVNEKGLKFEGAGAWLNTSKYAVGVTLPERGQEVTVTLDTAGFIRRVEPANGTGAPAAAPAQNGAPGATSGQQRDRTITRLAVLKAAAEYCASKEQSSSGDVLKIAASWEKWVTREEEPADTLTDAF